MITGTITESGVPVIQLDVSGTRYAGVIDTGFNGDLELPERLKSHVNARFLCRAQSLLAAGVAIEDDLYLVDFVFDGLRHRAQATFVAGEEILLGTGLLANHRLTVNFVAQTVRIQRLR